MTRRFPAPYHQRVRPLTPALLAATLLLAACSAPGPAPTGTPAPPSSSAPGPVTPSAPITHWASPAEVDAYLAQLRDIDPRLADNPAEAVGRAELTCIEAAATPADRLLVEVQRRYSDGALQLDDEQAHRVLDALRRHMCPEQA